MTLSLKNKIKKSNEICELYKTDEHTIESCCDNVGIPLRTFYEWIDNNNITEIAESYEKAKLAKYNVHRGKLKKLTLTSFQRKLKGWEYEEITIEGVSIDEKGTVKGKKIKKVKKLVIPGDAITIFALKNLAGYADKQNIEHSGSIQTVSNEERKEILKELKEGI